MARTLEYIHDRRVLVADIASRNFLLDSDMTIKFCDFSEASLLPLDVDMDTLDDNGYTTRIDLGFLGAVIYEVITFQLMVERAGREESSSPALKIFGLAQSLKTAGSTEDFETLVACYERWIQSPYIRLALNLQTKNFRWQKVFCFIQKLIDERPMVTLVVILGSLGTLALYINRKQL
ncbi:unnamed protein product [Penicillium bialowiezense]